MTNLSVTGVVHSLHYFEREFWLAYKTLESMMTPEDWNNTKMYLLKSKKIDDKCFEHINREEFEMNKALLDAEWKKKNEESKATGTAVHEMIRNELATDIFKCKKDYCIPAGDCKVESEDQFEMKDGLYPEFRMSLPLDDEFQLVGIADLIIKNGNLVTIIDYKGLPLDTPIATKDGWKTMGSISVGDSVFDKDGNIVQVIAKSKVHYNPCYKIKFDNGESIIADEDHKWLITFSNRGKNTEQVFTTKELKEYLKSLKKKYAWKIPKIKNAQPIMTEYKQLPIDPYVLGCWLGDGNSYTGRITNDTNNIWVEIQKRGYSISKDLSSSNRTEDRTIYGLEHELRLLKLLKNKHIPDLYLRASYDQRLDLLRGLMDTDGYYNSKRKRFIMETNHEWQKEGMIQLLGSLGIKPTVFNISTELNGKIYKGWSVQFSTNTLNPFLSRNQNIQLCQNNTPKYRNIVTVEETDIVATQCIKVNGNSHTYLFGYSMIPTHNTDEKIEMHSHYDMAKKKKKCLKYPMSKLEDCNYVHYKLQLSIYAYMLQKLYPNLKIDKLQILHIQDLKLKKVYEVEYLEKEVERLLTWYLKSTKLKIETEKCRERKYE